MVDSIVVLKEKDDQIVAQVQSLIFTIWGALKHAILWSHGFSIYVVLRRVACLAVCPLEMGSGQRAPKAVNSTCRRPEVGTIKLYFDASFHDGNEFG